MVSGNINIIHLMQSIFWFYSFVSLESIIAVNRCKGEASIFEIRSRFFTKTFSWYFPKNLNFSAIFENERIHTSKMWKHLRKTKVIHVKLYVSKWRPCHTATFKQIRSTDSFSSSFLTMLHRVHLCITNEFNARFVPARCCISRIVIRRFSETILSIGYRLVYGDIVRSGMSLIPGEKDRTKVIVLLFPG